MRTAIAILALAACCHAGAPTGNALVTYEHAHRPVASPAWAVVTTGDSTVLIDGTVYERNI